MHGGVATTAEEATVVLSGVAATWDAESTCCGGSGCSGTCAGVVTAGFTSTGPVWYSLGKNMVDGVGVKAVVAAGESTSI